MKTITFQGKEYTVPSWTRFMTQSKSGMIEAWRIAPHYGGDYWYFDGATEYKDNHEVISEELEMIIEALA